MSSTELGVLAQAVIPEGRQVDQNFKVILTTIEQGRGLVWAMGDPILKQTKMETSASRNACCQA